VLGVGDGRLEADPEVFLHVPVGLVDEDDGFIVRLDLGVDILEHLDRGEHELAATLFEQRLQVVHTLRDLEPRELDVGESVLHLGPELVGVDDEQHLRIVEEASLQQVPGREDHRIRLSAPLGVPDEPAVFVGSSTRSRTASVA